MAITGSLRFGKSDLQTATSFLSGLHTKIEQNREDRLTHADQQVWGPLSLTPWVHEPATNRLNVPLDIFSSVLFTSTLTKPVAVQVRQCLLSEVGNDLTLLRLLNLLLR